jgi:hypothetical protein
MSGGNIFLYEQLIAQKRFLMQQRLLMKQQQLLRQAQRRNKRGTLTGAGANGLPRNDLGGNGLQGNARLGRRKPTPGLAAGADAAVKPKDAAKTRQSARETNPPGDSTPGSTP